MITSFSGKYDWLSNFYSAKIKYEEDIFLSVEAAFQAAKTTDQKLRQEFINLPPNESKKLGRKIKLRDDWENIKISIMKELLKIKFSPNSELAKKLINTGSEILIEGNWWNDKFWGVCNGEGENYLGRLLMEIREELKNGEGI